MRLRQLPRRLRGKINRPRSQPVARASTWGLGSNGTESPVKRWSYSTLCPVCSCTKPCVLSNRTCMVLPSGPTSQRLIFTTLPPFLSDSSIVWLSILFSDTLVDSSLPLYGPSVPSSLAEKDRPIRSDISSASPVILKIVSSAWFETSPSVIRHAPEAR